MSEEEYRKKMIKTFTGYCKTAFDLFIDVPSDATLQYLKTTLKMLNDFVKSTDPPHEIGIKITVPKCEHEGCDSIETTKCTIPVHFDVEPFESNYEHHYYCDKHIQEAGYCCICGEFSAGTSGFDLYHQGVCDNCQDDMDYEDGGRKAEIDTDPMGDYEFEDDIADGEEDDFKFIRHALMFAKRFKR